MRSDLLLALLACALLAPGVRAQNSNPARSFIESCRRSSRKETGRGRCCAAKGAGRCGRRQRRAGAGSDGLSRALSRFAAAPEHLSRARRGLPADSQQRLRARLRRAVHRAASRRFADDAARDEPPAEKGRRREPRARVGIRVARAGSRGKGAPRREARQRIARRMAGRPQSACSPRSITYAGRSKPRRRITMRPRKICGRAVASRPNALASEKLGEIAELRNDPVAAIDEYALAFALPGGWSGRQGGPARSALKTRQRRGGRFTAATKASATPFSPPTTAPIRRRPTQPRRRRREIRTPRMHSSSWCGGWTARRFRSRRSRARSSC